MAGKPPLYPWTTALLLLLSTTTYAHYDSKSFEAASFVPSCARPCFQSFFNINFPNLDCGREASTLGCVCQQTGASGFTVGEGAVQCLLAAKSVDICSGEEANGESAGLHDFPRERRANISVDDAVGSAYRMCDDQPNAVQPTHPTIEATMLVDGSTRLIIPTPSLTISTTTSRSRSAPTTSDSPVTISASFSSRPTETVSAGPGDAEGAESDDDESSPSSSLSTAEIGGLAGGLAAAVALAVIAICLARRRRKKHYPDIETSFFMKSDRVKAISRRFTFLPTGQNISSPLHGSPNAPPKEFPMGEHGARGDRRRTFIFPKNVQRTVPPVRRVPTGTATPVAGLAVTAASAVPMAASRSDSAQNNQQKPVLSLAIPKNPATSSARQKKTGPKPEDRPPKLLVTAPTFEREAAKSNTRPERPSAQTSNPTIRTVEEDDSPLTEFEEDGRDSPIQVWRPPSLDPQSATTLYVADKTGNWVLADDRQKRRISLAELEGSSPVIPTGGSNNPAPGPSTTAEPPMAAAVLRAPAEIHRRVEQRRQMASMASSVYSSDMPAWNPSSPAPPVPTHPMLPKPLATRQGSAALPRPRYSPVLNPFLDENGVSPVRSMFGSRRAPPGTRPSPRMGSRPGRARSPPGQPSPTLGVEKRAGYGQRTPQQTRTPQQFRTPELRSYNPVRGSAFGTPPQDVQTSLLAKRLGPEKAASLSLRDSENSKATGRGSGGRGQLPSTPTWKPLMTPERRGDDLYLSLR